MILRTCMLALQSAVILEIFPPVTPGGFRLSMECRMPSNSATGPAITSQIHGMSDFTSVSDVSHEGAQSMATVKSDSKRSVKVYDALL